jgi:hypothetical protein
MKFFCRRCDDFRNGQPYRVFSEDEGEILLDMMVCLSCFQEARELGLHAEPLMVKAQPRPDRSADHGHQSDRH